MLKWELNLELQAFYTGHMERTYLQGPNEMCGLRTHACRNTLLGRMGGGGGNQAAVPIRDRESEHETRLVGIIMLLCCLFFTFISCSVLI